MEIIWYGQSCFLVRCKEVSIVTDPYYADYTGLKLPKNLKADIVTISHDHRDHNNKDGVLGQDEKKPFVIDGPGEYGLKGVEIIGVSSFHDTKQGAERGKNTIFVFNLEDLTVAHLGDLGHTLSDKEVEDLNQVDILFVPVGGNYTIDVIGASEVINQIDPKIVIPMHYKIDGLSSNLAIDGLDKFKKEVGESSGPIDLLKITQKDLPEEERKIIVLKAKIQAV